MTDIILRFFLFSFFGWVLESVYAAFKYKKFVSKQTLLKYPLCPIYGLGCLALEFLSEPAADSYALLFCGGFFAASAVEYLVGAYYEHFFKVKWWDYTTSAGNVGGKVCVFNSIAWGFLAIVFVKALLPFSDRLISSADTGLKLMTVSVAVPLFLKDYRDTAREIKKFAANEKSEAEGKFIALKRINC